MVDIYNLGCSRYRVEITETPAVGPPDDDVQMSPTWILSLPVLIGLGSLFFFSLSLSLFLSAFRFFLCWPLLGFPAATTRQEEEEESSYKLVTDAKED